MKTQTETLPEPLLLDPAGPNVVAIGGGHGQASALEAIQTYAGAISALVSVADDGGSSGRLAAMGIPPPGDVRRCLLALTPDPSLWSELFAHRFVSGDVSDHSLGNLILAALTDLYGDFNSAVDTAGRMLGVLGEVIPVADQAVALEAVIEGRRVRGQAAIARTSGHISELSIEPSDTMASTRALRAVAAADQIVIGPGSLYTSVISALMVQMLAPAVMTSSAQRVFVLNLVTQTGETLDMTGLDHLRALSQHVGVGGPGYVIVHDGPLDVPPRHDRVSVGAAEAAGMGWEVIAADVVDENAGWPEHDAFKLARVLEELSKVQT